MSEFDEERPEYETIEPDDNIRMPFETGDFDGDGYELMNEFLLTDEAPSNLEEVGARKRCSTLPNKPSPLVNTPSPQVDTSLNAQPNNCPPAVTIKKKKVKKITYRQNSSSTIKSRPPLYAVPHKQSVTVPENDIPIIKYLPKKLSIDHQRNTQSYSQRPSTCTLNSNNTRTSKTDPNIVLGRYDITSENRKFRNYTNMEGTVLTEEMLKPLTCDRDYRDMCYHEPIKLVHERSTTADDGGLFVKVGIQPNILRPDVVVKTDIHRSDRNVVKGRVLPARAMQKYTRDACVSISSVQRSVGENHYVCLTEGEFADRWELGQLKTSTMNPVNDSLSRADNLMKTSTSGVRAVGKAKQLKFFATIVSTNHIKGLVSWDRTVCDNKKNQVKAKRTIFLGPKHSQPPMVSTRVRYYCLGAVPKVKQDRIRGAMYTCPLLRAILVRPNYVIKRGK